MRNQQRYAVKKCGRQPSPTVLRLLRLRHPTVRLLWERRLQRWALCELHGAQWTLLCLVAGPGNRYEEPSIATVQMLDRMHPRNFRTKWQVERFLKGLDTSHEKMQYDLQKQKRVQIAEGSKELFNAINRRLVVAPQSTRPRRRRVRA